MLKRPLNDARGFFLSAAVAAQIVLGCATPARKVDRSVDLLSRQLLTGSASPESTIGVLPFRTSQGSVSELGRLISDDLADNIVKSRRFTSLDRAHLCALLSEVNLGTFGMTDQAAALKLGKLHAARYLVVGVLEPVGTSELVVQVRLIETETGRVASSARTTLPYDKDLQELYSRSATDDFCARPPTKSTRVPEPAPIAPMTGPWRVHSSIPRQVVDAFAVYHGRLYAAASGQQGSDGAVFRLDGRTWTEVLEIRGTEMASLAVFKDRLYAGGGMNEGALDAQLHSYDGETWTHVADAPNHSIKALAEFNGRLYAGGNHQTGAVYIFREPGSLKESFTLDTEIRSLEPFHGTLFAGTATHAKIAGLRDGIWKNYGNLPSKHVMALGTYKDRLFAATSSPGGVYEWDGKGWNPSIEFGVEYGNLQHLATHAGRLYVSSPGAPTRGRVLAYDGKKWSPDLDVPGQGICAMIEFNGALYAGGFSEYGARSTSVYVRRDD